MQELEKNWKVIVNICVQMDNVKGYKKNLNRKKELGID